MRSNIKEIVRLISVFALKYYYIEWKMQNE